jgi:hypothetical protein
VSAIRNNGRHRRRQRVRAPAKCPKGKLDLAFPDLRGNIESAATCCPWLYPAQAASGVTADGRANILAFIPCGISSRLGAINRRQDGRLELPPKIVQERVDTHQSLWGWMSVITVGMDVCGHLFPWTDDGAELASAVGASVRDMNAKWRQTRERFQRNNQQD